MVTIRILTTVYSYNRNILPLNDDDGRYLPLGEAGGLLLIVPPAIHRLTKKLHGKVATSGQKQRLRIIFTF